MTEDTAQKLNSVFSWAIWASLLLAMAGELVARDWGGLMVAIVIAIVIWLPVALPERFNITVPKPFIIATIAFLYASLFLGEFGDFYEKFWWWDALLHSFSAFAFGLLGIIIILIIHRRGQVVASPFVLAVFAFCFALSIGALWEVVEFIIDQTFDTNMQKSGLMDTMWDLIVDSAGALISAVIGYRYWKMRKSKNNLVSTIEEAVDENC